MGYLQCKNGSESKKEQCKAETHSRDNEGKADNDEKGRIEITSPRESAKQDKTAKQKTAGRIIVVNECE